MMKADDPAKRSFECEADIMGAYAVLSRELARLEDPNEEQQRALVARLDRIVGVAQRLEMGINGAFTHPNADQRLTAIRSGAGRAVYELPKLVQASAEVGLVRDRLARIHDIRTGEDAAAWSGRMCRLILHPGAAVPSIAMDKPVFQWSKSADQPYVDYSIPYRNNGSSPIHMTVVIRAASILRSDREKQAAWIYSDASRNEFDVEPGGTYNVAGRLQWYATEERMPRLVYPHVPGSLFDADVLAASTSSQSAPSPTMLDPSPELLNLQSALQALYTDAPNHFRNRAPPCPSEYGMETCPLPIAIDGVISSEVNRYEDGSSEAYLELYRGTSELEAIAAYDAFRNKLVRIYPSLNFTPTTRPNGSVQIVLKPFLKVELTLSRRMRDNGTWIVSAIIEPKFY